MNIPFANRMLRFFAAGCSVLLVSKNLHAQEPIAAVPQVQGASSPDAASFGSYSSLHNVNYYTGMAVTNIPVYTVEYGGVSVPVSLMYNASGIKVHSVAGSVGTGWALNAGGVITREVRGVADDNYILGVEEGYQYQKAYVASINPATGDINVGAGLNHMNVNNYDGEPDIFNFTFGGRSGKFLIDVVSGALKVKTIPYQNLKVDIEKTIPGDPYHISGFVITDEGGVQYVFRNFEITTSVTNSSYTNTELIYPVGWVPIAHPETKTTAYHSSWYLSKIITANKAEILFEYNTAYNQTITGPTAYSTNNCYDNTCVYTNSPGIYRLDKKLFYSWSINTSTVATQLISKIKTDAEEIVFTPVSNRSDIPGSKSISEISIYNKRFSLAPVLAKKYALEYTAGGTGGLRLFLTKLKEQIVTGGSTYINPYTFEYNNASLLPEASSKEIDVWGYYNGPTSHGSSALPIPTLYVYPGETPNKRFSVFYKSTTNTQVLYGANRNPSETHAQYGVLTKVVYPDGGYTDYEYELHKFNTPDFGVVTGGGLRLKKATTYDGFNVSKQLSRRYEYLLTGGTSSGKILSLPVFGYDIGDYGEEGLDCSTMEYYHTRTTRTSEPINGSDAYKIGYTKVTEYIGDNGKSEFEYSMPATEGELTADGGLFKSPETDKGKHPDHQYNIFRNACGAPMLTTSEYIFPYAPKPEYDWSRGMLLSQKDYDALGSVYHIKTNTYTLKAAVGVDAPATMSVIKLAKVYNPGDGGFYWYTYSFYNQTTGYTRILSSTEDKVYDLKPGVHNELVTTETYSFDNPDLLAPTSVKTVNSDGIEYTKKTIYSSSYENLSLVTGANNMPARALQEMMTAARHILNTPVEETSYMKKPGSSEVVIGSKLTTFKILPVSGNPIVQDKEYTLDLSNPSSSFVVSKVQPSGTGSPGDFIFSTSYRQTQAYDLYDSRINPVQVTQVNGISTTTIYNINVPLATLSNAKRSDCSYLGFERAAIASPAAADPRDDYWGFYNPFVLENTDAHTGKYSLRLQPGGSARQTFTVSTTGKYILSCWVKTQSGFATNLGFVKIGTTTKTFSATNGAWVYVEVIADIATPQSCQVTNGSGSHYVLVDDIQFRPYASQANYTTYDPVSAKPTSTTDNNQISNYMEYDGFGRVLKTLNKDKQLLTYMGYYQKSSSASSDRSYTKTYRAVATGVSHTSEATVSSSPNVRKSVAYLDGLGRTIQSVQIAASPLGNDIVIPYDYDHLGRQIRNYLPFASSDGQNGIYRSDALTLNSGQQSMFYRRAQRVARAYGNPWYENRYESSALNRLMERAAPGFGWMMDKGHTELHYYRTNTCLDDVLFWTKNLTTTTWEATQLYTEGTLYVEELRDQNYNWVLSFKDKLGRKICQYTQKKEGLLPHTFKNAPPPFSYTYYTVTYNLYNDLGQLYATIDPEGMQKLADQKAFNLPVAFINKWVTIYEYDAKGRTIAKNRGKENEELYVYDKLDRVVLTRTNTLGANKWNYTKYDILGRTILSGIYNTGTNQETLQSSADNVSTVLFETRSNVSFVNLQGYTNVAFPILSGSDYGTLLSVNYYDDYDFDYNGTPEVTNTATRTIPDRGRLMGSKQRSLKSDGTVNLTWMQSENYYDDFGRIIKARSDNHASLGGSDVFDNIYDYNNNKTKTTRTHTKTLGSTVATTVVYDYEYDNMLRLKKTFHKVNAGTQVLLSQLNYNELGQVYEKNLHSTNSGTSYLQSVDYSYDALGHLTHINRLDLANDLTSKTLGMYPVINGAGIKAPVTLYNFSAGLIKGSQLLSISTTVATQVQAHLQVKLYEQGGPVKLSSPDYMFTAMSQKLITDLGNAHGGLVNFEEAIVSNMPCGITSYSNDNPTSGVYDNYPGIKVFQKTFIDKLKNHFGGITTYTRTQIKQKADDAYQEVYSSFQLQYDVATAEDYFLPNENGSLTTCGAWILNANFINAYVVHINGYLPSITAEQTAPWEDVNDGLIAAINAYSTSYCSIEVTAASFALTDPAEGNLAAIEQISQETAKGFTRLMEEEGFTEDDFALFQLQGLNESEAEADPEYIDKPFTTKVAYESKSVIRKELTKLHNLGTASESGFIGVINTELAGLYALFTPASPLVGGQQIFNDDDNDLWGLELKYDAVLSPVSARPQYNGNIGQAFWKLKNETVISAYDYSYDALDRLAKASFYQYTSGSSPVRQKVDYYSVPEMTYDNNGNILTVKRNGNISDNPVGAPAWGLQDDLIYKYAGNKLLSINDLAETPNQQANIVNLLNDNCSGTILWVKTGSGTLAKINVSGNDRLQLETITLSDNPVMSYNIASTANGKVYHLKMHIDIGTASNVNVKIKSPGAIVVVDESITQTGTYTFMFGADQNFTTYTAELSASGTPAGGVQRRFSIDDIQINRVFHLNPVQYGYNDNDIELNGTDGVSATQEYRYTANGSMTTDWNKGIKMISYNTMNLPAEIRFYNGNKLQMEYSAAGAKLSQILSIYQGTTNTYTTSTNLYAGGIIYENAATANPVLSYMFHDEGRAVKTGGTFEYEYSIHDQTGTSRITFKNVGGVATVVQKGSFYPFGMKIYDSEISMVYSGVANPHEFNGKESVAEGVLDMYDYGARLYDASVGRWNCPDPANQFFSPYVFCANNPVIQVDKDGKMSHAYYMGLQYQNSQIMQYSQSHIDRTWAKIDAAVMYAQGSPEYKSWVNADLAYVQTMQDKYGAYNFGSSGAGEGYSMKPLTMNDIHTGLDLIGIVDPYGLADGLNAVLYTIEGDALNASISTAAASLPYIGDAAKSFRMRNVAVGETIHQGAEIADNGKTMSELLVKAGDAYKEMMATTKKRDQQSAEEAEKEAQIRFQKSLNFQINIPVSTVVAPPPMAFPSYTPPANNTNKPYGY